MSLKPPKLAVIMITFNEAHNLQRVLDNLRGFADEIFILDSFSTDRTVEIALQNGAVVKQRAFDGFGNQWNAALSKFDVKSEWVMKLDPDESISEPLKWSIKDGLKERSKTGFFVTRHLWFMGNPIHVRQKTLRIWRNGTCTFTNSSVNEHPVVTGKKAVLKGDLEHFDSPDLHHWMTKQNAYSTAEALQRLHQEDLADDQINKHLEKPVSWKKCLKRHFHKIPFRFQLVFFYCFFILGAWRSGYRGYIWAHLRSEIYRMREYKFLELEQMDKANDQVDEAGQKASPFLVGMN